MLLPCAHRMLCEECEGDVLSRLQGGNSLKSESAGGLIRSVTGEGRGATETHCRVDWNSSYNVDSLLKDQ